MRSVIAVIVGALIYYISYHGSIGVLYDIIGLVFTDQASQKGFVRSPIFDDIAAFSGFILPTIVSATFLGLMLKEQHAKFCVIVCGLYSIALWAALAFFFGAGSEIWLSDLVAPLSALPIAWFVFSLVKRSA
ncbi:hypothetical protein [Psychrobium sp. 1_MG-2023]|uniref:hypothetical protein n=1 Tax=Psychrobium sp. 1_MG-2023 TaxID=3062624 RepID=UPI000C34F379|nr:hypothetical protein [Psychrobium sp. 1_MG-2023]MDP2561278.1 hypothetical protein [Psychrobium sp. 1_MG-2023]PKF55222.1 hypothetical protein CW748_13445 [Alteromonadales bacterium alter-6D02]